MYLKSYCTPCMLKSIPWIYSRIFYSQKWEHPPVLVTVWHPPRAALSVYSQLATVSHSKITTSNTHVNKDQNHCWVKNYDTIIPLFYHNLWSLVRFFFINNQLKKCLTFGIWSIKNIFILRNNQEVSSCILHGYPKTDTKRMQKTLPLLGTQ